MSLYITTETTSDLPKEMESYVDTKVLPMVFIIDGTEYTAMDAKEFYDLIRAGKLPTTSMVNEYAAKEFLEEIVKQGHDVLHIAFSSGLSGTCKSFMDAASQLQSEYPQRKIAVVDSLAASGGEGLLFYYAVKKRDSGASFEELVDYITTLRNNVCHYFTANDLFHLLRGGRVSKTQAIAGSMLQLKPVMHVTPEGKLAVVGKVMGRKKSLLALVDKMAEKQDTFENEAILISHGDCFSEAEFLAEKVKERFPVKTVYFSDIGPIIGAHLGAGGMTLFFLGKNKEEVDL